MGTPRPTLSVHLNPITKWLPVKVSARSGRYYGKKRKGTVNGLSRLYLIANNFVIFLNKGGCIKTAISLGSISSTGSAGSAAPRFHGLEFHTLVLPCISRMPFPRNPGQSTTVSGKHSSLFYLVFLKWNTLHIDLNCLDMFMSLIALSFQFGNTK